MRHWTFCVLTDIRKSGDPSHLPIGEDQEYRGEIICSLINRDEDTVPILQLKIGDLWKVHGQKGSNPRVEG